MLKTTQISLTTCGCKIALAKESECLYMILNKVHIINKTYSSAPTFFRGGAERLSAAAASGTRK